MNLLHCIYELASYILLFDVDEFISFLLHFSDYNFDQGPISLTIFPSQFKCDGNFI